MPKLPLTTLVASAAALAIPFLAPEVKAHNHLAPPELTLVAAAPSEPPSATLDPTPSGNDWIFTVLKVGLAAGGSAVTLSDDSVSGEHSRPGFQR